MKRALVTGGTGFVGANLVRRLLADGHEVHLLVRRGYQDWRIKDILADLRMHEVNLEDDAQTTMVVAAIRPDWLFHLAVHGAYSWQTDALEIMRTNVMGTVNLVEAGLRCGFEAFVNTGSSSEYGLKGHAPSETEWLDPNSTYAVAKAASTLFCRQRALSHDARISTLRLYSVYGPYEDPRRLIPALLQQARRGQWPPLADPQTARDYVYIDDVCEAYLLAATAPEPEKGGVYNVGTGVQTTLAEIVEQVRLLLDVKAEPQWGTLAGRIWDTNVWVADNRKLTGDLGWRAEHSLLDGLAQNLKWLASTE